MLGWLFLNVKSLVYKNGWCKWESEFNRCNSQKWNGGNTRQNQANNSASSILSAKQFNSNACYFWFYSSSKTDHIRLTFPTYGRPGDDSDPLLYLSKCDDFLALHPLADTDILATFRTVLHGTARDWWEITRTKVTSWEEFKASFVSAFLAEDYEDELAERVRTKKQGENESIRDFAYSYRALCTRWNPDLTELDIVKLIVKHIKPYLASQLRGRVNDVDELVRLGHQLERDHDQQLEYERKLQVRKVNSLQKGTYPGSQQGEKTPLCLALQRVAFSWFMSSIYFYLFSIC